MLWKRMGSRGTALMELAIFGAIALSALGFFLRTLASEFGTIHATQDAFRLCLFHAAEDNGVGPYEARSVGGYLQLAVPSVSLQSWDVSANEVRRSCFVEWGSHLTMSNADGPCAAGKGDPIFFGYSGGNGASFKYSDVPCDRMPLDERSTISNKSAALTEQTTSGGTTTGTATPSGCSTLTTTLLDGSTVKHGVCYGGESIVGSTSAP